MILLQWWCGARSGELVQLRPCDVDRNGTVWQFRPTRHKSEHHGRDRVIELGPRAQEVLAEFLHRVPPPSPEMQLFRPDEAEAERRVEQRRRRRTRVQPSQAKRRPKPTRKRPFREAYDVNSYRHAIARGIAAANAAAQREAIARAVLALVDERARPFIAEAVEHLAAPINEERLGRALARAACKIASLRRLGVTVDPAPLLERAARAIVDAPRIPDWHPHQLRHSCATRLRREAGLEAARVVLGHASPMVTEIYAEIDGARAREVAAQLG